MFGAFRSSKDNKNMFKIAKTFDHFNVNLRKKEGFLTYIPRIPIPGKINTNNKKRVIRINKECLKDNPVLHLSTTRIIMTAGRCTFWGLLLRVHGKCDR